MKEEPISHKVEFNAKKRIFGSLAFRVLIISFLFIIFPLIIYAIFLFSSDYKQKIKDTFQDLALLTEAQVKFVTDFETDNLNFLSALYNLIAEMQSQEKQLNQEMIRAVLQKFANNERIEAISFLTVMPNQDLVCTHSTYPAYQGINFTQYFNVPFINTVDDNVFIAKDPLFNYSLFLIYTLRNEQGQPTGVVVASIPLTKIINWLDKREHAYDATISILDENHATMVTTRPPLFAPSPVPLTPMQGEKDGFYYSIEGVKWFAVMLPFPATEQFLLISIPATVPLLQMYEYLSHLGSFLIFILIVGGAACAIFTWRIAKPLKQLGAVMMRVGEGNLDARFQEDPLGFEINYLGEEFNQMISSLILHIEETKKERASKEAYAKELQIGHEIQQSILPAKKSNFPGIEVGVYFSPAKEVAGDFYDWLIQDNRVMMTIADGVGKGVSGALYSFDLRSILRSFATTHADIKKVVMETNRLFMHDTKETGSFVTAFIAMFDSTDNTLRYVNCGHNYPIVKHNSGKIGRLAAVGTAFGVQEFAEVFVGEMLLTFGDFIIFYTDGISEAQNKAQKLFTEARLEDVIRASHAQTPDQMIKEILAAVNTFVDGAEQYDDMTLIIFKLLDK